MRVARLVLWERPEVNVSMMKLAKMSLVLGVTLLAPAAASADQCAWVEQQIAEDAVQLIDVGARIVSFCEPCGEQQAVEIDVATVSAAPVEDGFWEVSVNGSGIDLAYTFVANGDGKWVNLSKMVDCPSAGVSCMLDESLDTFAASGGICEEADESKFDELSDEEAASGCAVGARGGAGGTAFALFGLLALLAIRRRRA